MTTTTQPRRTTRKSAASKATATSAAGKKAAPKKQAPTAAEKKAAAAKQKAAAEKQKAADLLSKTKAETERKLPSMAREINVRLEKAETMEHKADDHRLAAAQVLGEAKTRCEAAKMSFKDWCETAIVAEGRSFETIRKLASVGQSDEPALALADMRGKNKAANKKHRDSKKASASSASASSSKTKPQVGAIDAAEQAFGALNENGQRNLLQTLGKKAGVVMMDAAKVEQLNKRAATSDTTVKAGTTAGYQQAQAMFNGMTARTKMEFLQWAAGEVGAEINLNLGGSDNSEPDLTPPAGLDIRGTKRTRKTRAKKAA